MNHCKHGNLRHLGCAECVREREVPHWRKVERSRFRRQLQAIGAKPSKPQGSYLDRLLATQKGLGW